MLGGTRCPAKFLFRLILKVKNYVDSQEASQHNTRRRWNKTKRKTENKKEEEEEDM